MEREMTIYGGTNSKLPLKITPGHFVTSHSHVNYYVDLTGIKMDQKNAKMAALEMAPNYMASVEIDTIVCMDGCEAIGAYLADELTKDGYMSVNGNKSLCILTPEFNANGQLILRDNIQGLVKGKKVLLLLATTTTGKTVSQSLECIGYYGGRVQGIAALFSAVNSVDGIPVYSIFQPDDVEGYQTYEYQDCPFCKANKKLDAIINANGYTVL